MHTGLKKTPFELHHGRKLGTKLTNLKKDGKSFLSNWSGLSVSAESRPKKPIYVPRNSDGEVSNYQVTAWTKAEKTMTEKSPKNRNSGSIYPFKFFEENHNKKSLEGRFQPLEGGYHIHETFGYDIIVISVTGEKLNKRKSAPVPLQKPTDFGYDIIVINVTGEKLNNRKSAPMPLQKPTSGSSRM